VNLAAYTPTQHNASAASSSLAARSTRSGALDTLGTFGKPGVVCKPDALFGAAKSASTLPAFRQWTMPPTVRAVMARRRLASGAKMAWARRMRGIELKSAARAETVTKTSAEAWFGSVGAAGGNAEEARP
jgi:hypothetical protein